MNRIDIRGVIVPSDYDDEWYADYIERGIITPESRFRAALAAADTGEPLNIYVNSPGGSVFAGNEMQNAVREWKASTGQPVTVTVGALAASAASALAIGVADRIEAHSNSKMMFHGAYTGTIGGSEAHADGAELLNKINADIKTTLVSRYEIDADTVNEWFSEGREGWLGSDEMATAGIAHEIIGEPAAIIDFDTAAVSRIEEHGLDIAAFASIAIEESASDDEAAADQDADEDTTPDADEPEVDILEEEPDECDAPDDTPAEDPETPDEDDNAVDVASPLYLAGCEAGRAAGLGETQAQLESLMAELETTQANARKMQSERDKLQSDTDAIVASNAATISDLTEKLGHVNENLAKLTIGSLTFSPGVETWPEALAEHGGDYAKASKAYPELAREYDKINGRK